MDNCSSSALMHHHLHVYFCHSWALKVKFLYVSFFMLYISWFVSIDSNVDEMDSLPLSNDTHCLHREVKKHVCNVVPSLPSMKYILVEKSPLFLWEQLYTVCYWLSGSSMVEIIIDYDERNIAGTAPFDGGSVHVMIWGCELYECILYSIAVRVIWMRIFWKTSEMPRL